MNLRRLSWFVLIFLFTAQNVSAYHLIALTSLSMPHSLVIGESSNCPEPHHYSHHHFDGSDHQHSKHACFHNALQKSSMLDSEHEAHKNHLECENCLYHFQLSLLSTFDFESKHYSNLSEITGENTIIPSAPFYNLYRPPILI